MCCTENSSNDADEFFKALTHVREQVETAFAEVSATQGDQDLERANRERTDRPEDETDLVAVYLELASRKERKD